MSKHDPKITLQQMRDYADRAQRLCAGRKPEDLEKELEFRLALERALEVIGEAAFQLGDEFHAEHPEVEWRKIIGMRNVLAHGYDVIRADILWDIAVRDAPTLLAHIDRMLRKLSGNNG